MGENKRCSARFQPLTPAFFLRTLHSHKDSGYERNNRMEDEEGLASPL